MADSVVQVDLSDQAADFRRLALQPGMGLIDRSGAHTAILRKWLGAYLAEPAWDGNFVKYQIRGEDGAVLSPKSLLPLTAAECKGAFRSEIAAMLQKLEAAPARTGTERALRHVMLERLKKLQADPKLAAQSGALAKYGDAGGLWRLVWLWGFERKSSEAGTVVICKKPNCRTLAVLSEDRRSCPACGAKLKVSRSPVPLLAGVLVLLLLAGGVGYWFNRPAAELLPEPLVLKGQVYSAVGQKPIAGASIRVKGSETEVSTDAQGRFELNDLSQESNTLLIAASGFRPEELEANSANTGQEFLKVAMRGQAELRGRVQDQINGHPIAGASISLPEWGIETQTDDQGAFHIADVPGGKVQIAASAEGFQRQAMEQTLSANGPRSAEFRLAGRGKLVGTVIDALTLSPVPQATVFLLNTPLTASTDAQGRFEITGIASGAATIAVQAAGYQPEHSDQELKGTEVRPFLVGLHGAGLVRGRVLAQADGEPLAGARVEMMHPKFSRTVKTNDRGEFELEKLPPSQCELLVTFPGFRDEESQVTANETGKTLEISLAGNALLTGTVADAVEKKPIFNAEVHIAGTELTAQTGEDGKFSLPDVPGRDAIVQIVGRGYRLVEQPQKFEAGKETRIAVELKGGTILSGQVRDAETKSPVAQAEVQLAGTTQKAQTDAEGRFRFEDAAAGKKTLHIAAAGYRAAAEEAELKTEEESHVEIILKGDAVLVGTVVSAAGEEPLSGALVKIAGTSRETWTDEQGGFRLEDVPSGTVDLDITLPGYQPGSASRDLAGGENPNIDIALTGAAVLLGSVVDQEGQRIADAVVQIEDTSTEIKTDEAGQFRQEGLLPGDVKLRISAKGFHSEQKTAHLDRNEPTSLGEIKLRPLVEPLEVVAKPFDNPAPAGVIDLDGNATVDVGLLIPRDDFRTRLELAGAKTGDVQVSLAWDNVNDIDLHVQAPSGEVIYYGNRRSKCGGELDVDRNANGPGTAEPVENAYWPLNTAPRGTYKVLVHHYANHGGQDPTEFRVAVKNGTEVKYYTGKIGPDEKVLVCEFERGTGPAPVLIAGRTCRDCHFNDEVNLADTLSFLPGGRHSPDALGTGETEDPRKIPPVYNRGDEDLASQRLKLAEDLLALNKPDAAKRWLDDVSRSYPNTNAGKKGKRILDELTDAGSNVTDIGEGIYLADLSPVRENVGGDLQTRAVNIAGDPKRHSLWTRTNLPNPPASVEYALGRRYTRLSGSVGLDDSGQADRTRVSTSFQIVGDGKVLWSSPALRDPGKSQRFEVDVSNVNTLKILADSNRNPSHYAVWIDPWLAGRGKP